MRPWPRRAPRSTTGRWAGKSPAARKRTLIKFADLVLKNTAELALLETLDMGKPIKYSQSVDVPSCANCIRWYGEAIDKIYDEIAPTADSSLALITREPVGVVGAIVPWNYPLIMTAWKIAPALAAGNSVVLKPSEKSPLSALRLAEIALEAGIPAGVFNVVPGYGHEAGAALALHMDVDCIAFTGSTRGRQEDHADGRPVEPEARLDRVGRQVGQHRLRRLPRPGRGGEARRSARSTSTRARAATRLRACSSKNRSRTASSKRRWR